MYTPPRVTPRNGHQHHNALHDYATQTARLLDPIEETDAGRIADCLGLDSRRFQNMHKVTLIINLNNTLITSVI